MMTGAGRGPGPWAAAAWVAAATLAQAAWLSRWAPGLRLDLPLALSVALALCAGEGRALAWSFVAGLAVDALSCGPMGLNALLNLAAARATLAARRALFSHRAAFQAAIALVMALGKAAAFDAVLALSFPHLAWGGLTVSSAGGAVAMAALAPFLAWALAGPRGRAAWRSSWFAHGNG